jgi:hypothetical protein
MSWCYSSTLVEATGMNLSDIIIFYSRTLEEEKRNEKVGFSFKSSWRMLFKCFSQNIFSTADHFAEKNT